MHPQATGEEIEVDYKKVPMVDLPLGATEDGALLLLLRITLTITITIILL